MHRQKVIGAMFAFLLAAAAGAQTVNIGSEVAIPSTGGQGASNKETAAAVRYGQSNEVVVCWNHVFAPFQAEVHWSISLDGGNTFNAGQAIPPPTAICDIGRTADPLAASSPAGELLIGGLEQGNHDRRLFVARALPGQQALGSTVLVTPNSDCQSVITRDKPSLAMGFPRPSSPLPDGERAYILYHGNGGPQSAVRGRRTAHRGPPRRSWSSMTCLFPPSPMPSWC